MDVESREPRGARGESAVGALHHLCEVEQRLDLFNKVGNVVGTLFGASLRRPAVLEGFYVLPMHSGFVLCAFAELVEIRIDEFVVDGADEDVVGVSASEHGLGEEDTAGTKLLAKADGSDDCVVEGGVGERRVKVISEDGVAEKLDEMSEAADGVARDS